ncbi:MAG: ribonuclease G [Rhodobacteraceae bacterium]|nr:MAG: ribonuclease G [Paracoccaceae bacterium]
MKQGRLVVLDTFENRAIAALMVNGKLHDLLVDPKSDAPRPGAIYCGKASQPMKGQNGIILDLGNGQKGFLKQAKGIAPGQMMRVQVATRAEAGKASPVTTKLLFKSRYAIVTPDAPGINVARSIRDEDDSERLREIAHEAFEDAPQNCGLILRSACAGVDDGDIYSDIAAMLQAANAVLSDTSGTAELLLDANDAHEQAWVNWPDADEIIPDDGSFETLGVWDHIDALGSPEAALAQGASMVVEPTRALVAVDVNTGSDQSLMAGLKANLATARDLPRQLRLRGLGGQIVIDFAPSPKKDRRAIETELKRAFRADSIDTILVGWTTLGHYELQRKRERLPLTELLDL